MAEEVVNFTKRMIEVVVIAYSFNFAQENKRLSNFEAARDVD